MTDKWLQVESTIKARAGEKIKNRQPQSSSSQIVTPEPRMY